MVTKWSGDSTTQTAGHDKSVRVLRRVGVLIATVLAAARSATS